MTDILDRAKTFLSAFDGVTLYDGHPAVIVREMADRISTLERELEEARGIIMAREALHAANLGVDFDRISVLTARDMARQALDAKAALTAAEAKVARMEEAMKQVVADYDACSGAEPSLSVLHRSIDLVARSVLEEQKQ